MHIYQDKEIEIKILQKMLQKNFKNTKKKKKKN